MRVIASVECLLLQDKVASPECNILHFYCDSYDKAVLMDPNPAFVECCYGLSGQADVPS